MARISTLIDEARIAARVRELGAQIRADAGDAPITLVGVLKGSFLFLADLARAIEGPVTVEFLGVSSYHGGTHSTGAVQLTQDLRAPIAGRYVVVIEDIVDTGLTLDYLLRMLKARDPASIRVATLLDKPSRRQLPVEADYVGFTIPDVFVIGYGLDLDEFERNLPYVAVVES
jgi:hypoxanthine phosphoribosyltransferase